MIDEAWLDDIEKSSKFYNEILFTDNQAVLDLAQLARLGLWARKHAIPALEAAKLAFCSGNTSDEQCAEAIVTEAQHALLDMNTKG